MNTSNNKISLGEIERAQQNIKELVKHTPLIKMLNFSENYRANIFLREKICKEFVLIKYGVHLIK